MPETSPLLTIMCHGRNDNYHDGFLYRLSTALNTLGRNLEILGAFDAVEILVLDWGSEDPLYKNLNLNSSARRVVRFINCPPEISKKYDRDSNYSHVHVVNALARRARGKYLLLSDADSFIPLETFAQLMFHLRQGYVGPNSLQRTFFWGSRWHVPVDFVRSSPSFEQLEQHIRKNWTSYATDQMSHENFQCAASVLLISRDMYVEATGLWEKLIYWGWQDIEFHRRLCRRYSWEDLERLGMRFFHLEHYIDRANTPVSASRKVNETENAPRFAANGEDWGLGNEKLEITDCNGRVLNPSREIKAEQVMNQLDSAETLSVAQILANNAFREHSAANAPFRDLGGLNELSDVLASCGSSSMCVVGDHFDHYTSHFSKLPQMQMLISLDHWDASKLGLEILQDLAGPWRAYLFECFLRQVAINGRAEKVYPLPMDFTSGLKAFEEGKVTFDQVFFAESVYAEELAWLIHDFTAFAPILCGVMPKEGAGALAEMFNKMTLHLPPQIPEPQWRLHQWGNVWLVLNEAALGLRK